MASKDIRKNYRYSKKNAFETTVDKPLDRSDAKKAVEKSVEEFAELQEMLYADNRHSLLLVFQGMDAAGKDSTIEKVTSGVNPAGFQVFSFKKPSSEEMDHNFLWRCWQRMPERGRIGIYNRSYYEEVLVVKVHPAIVQARQLPNKKVDKQFWQQRYHDISQMEQHLANNGTRVVKFFLNVSKEEQRERFLSRLESPEKYWKFSSADLRERRFWDDYQKAFRDAIEATDSDDAPWYVVPADDKWNMRAVVADIIVEELKDLDLSFPEPDESEVALFEAARKELNED
jgi:PPK2 family polyphosphate:nucleotide phosphotransferase